MNSTLIDSLLARRRAVSPWAGLYFLQSLLINLALGGYGNNVYDVDTPQLREKKGPDGKVLKDENGKKIMEPTGKIIPAAKFPMEMKVDYVRYYEREK